MFNNTRNFIRKFSTITRQYNEIKIPVPWGHISGKWWEPSNTRPILAVHGWQDNSGSFDRLIPLLNKDVGILAIDLPGHGFSSRLPTGLYYENMNYPIIIRYIMKHFNWPKVSLMGHSLGAISCYTFSMMYHEDMDLLILLDGIKPLEIPNHREHLAKGIDEFLKYDEHAKDTEEPPSYPLEEIKKKIAAALDNSIDVKYAEYIIARNIKPSAQYPDKYFITRDPRLKSNFFSNWPQNELISYARQIKVPTLLLKATKSGFFEDKKNFLEVLKALQDSNSNCFYHEVEGRHHFHLNNPEVANDLINKFINDFDKTDRAIGGINEAVKV